MKGLNFIFALLLVGTLFSCGSDNTDEGAVAPAPAPAPVVPVVKNPITASCTKLSSLLKTTSFRTSIGSNDPWGGTGLVDITNIGYKPIGYDISDSYSSSFFNFTFTSWGSNSCSSEFSKTYYSTSDIQTTGDSDYQIYVDKINSFGTTDAKILASLRSYLTKSASCTEKSTKVFEVCKDSIECIVVNFNYPLFANPTRYTHKITNNYNNFGTSYYNYNDYSGFETSCWSSF